MIDLSIIIVTYNSAGLIKECLASIKKHIKEIEYEVIVVDNNSTDRTVEKIQNSKFPSKTRLASGGKIQNDNSKFKIIENKNNVGFAAGNNIGIKKARGRYILLLNPDTKLIENSFLTMVLWMDEHLKVGVSSCRLINPDGSTQATGGFFPTPHRVFLWATFLDDLPFAGNLFGSYHPHTNFYTKERSLDWVTGAFFLIRREVVEKAGLLDEDFFLYVEEVEYCMRVKKLGLSAQAGWEVWYVPATAIIHHSGASGTKEQTVLREFTGLKILYSKHFSPLQQFILRLFLFVGSFVRMILFGIMNFDRGRIYAKAIRSI